MDRSTAFAAVLLACGPAPDYTFVQGDVTKEVTKEVRDWRHMAKHYLFTALECSKISSPMRRNDVFAGHWRDFLTWLEFHNGGS